MTEMGEKNRRPVRMTAKTTAMTAETTAMTAGGTLTHGYQLSDGPAKPAPPAPPPPPSGGGGGSRKD